MGNFVGKGFKSFPLCGGYNKIGFVTLINLLYGVIKAVVYRKNKDKAMLPMAMPAALIMEIMFITLWLFFANRYLRAI